MKLLTSTKSDFINRTWSTNTASENWIYDWFSYDWLLMIFTWFWLVLTQVQCKIVTFYSTVISKLPSTNLNPQSTLQWATKWPSNFWIWAWNICFPLWLFLTNFNIIFHCLISAGVLYSSDFICDKQTDSRIKIEYNVPFHFFMSSLLLYLNLCILVCCEIRASLKWWEFADVVWRKWKTFPLISYLTMSKLKGLD